jgi:hypothetical protein
MVDLLTDSAPDIDRQVSQLRRVEAWVRWLWIALIWLTLGTWSCWEMRESLIQLYEYLSWTGIQYSFFFHLMGGGGGLIICLSMTASCILWQIGQTFLRVSPRERQRLEAKVQRIQKKGSKHPLWRWIQ